MPGEDNTAIFQKEELESLTVVYCDELKILKEIQPYKLKIEVKPLLEDESFDHHYEYDNPTMSIFFTIPKEYPSKAPKYYFETLHPRISGGTKLLDIKKLTAEFVKSVQGEPCIMEIVEFVRKWMYSKIAKTNKHFKKRTHRLNEDYEFFDDEDSEGEGEELAIKETHTPVTFASFNTWRITFNSEMRAKKMKNPDYVRKQQLKLKKSGRDFFDEKVQGLSIYIMDEKVDDEDDDVVDIEITGKDIEDMSEDEDVDIDHDAFEGEDEDSDSSIGDVFE